MPKCVGKPARDQLSDNATFVVAADGVVKARFVDPDYRKRMAIEDILAAVRQIAS